MQYKTYELTLSQLDIFLDQEKYPTLPLYNVGGYVEINSAVSIDQFRQAFSQQVRLHDAFYLRFLKVGKKIEQYVSEQKVELTEHDFSDHVDPEAEAKKLITKSHRNTFNIEKDILHRSGLIRLGEAKYWYYSVSHHLIMDGWAYAIWVKNLIQRYMFLMGLDTQSPGNEPIEFIENVEKQGDYQNSKKYQKSLEYWTSEISELSDSVLEPKESAVGFSLSSRRIVKNISHEIYQEWKCLAEAMDGQVHHLFLALLYIYFRRTSGKEVIAIGLPSRNRSSREKGLVGSFVSVRPLCVTADSNARVGDIIKILKKKLATNSRHQRFPLYKIIESIETANLNNGRLFDIQFNYQLLDYKVGSEDCPTATYFLSNDCERTPFSLNICEYGEHQEIQLQIDTNDAYFEAGEGELLFERLMHMLKQVSSDKEILSADIDILPTKEKTLIYGWASKETTAPLNTRIEHLFDEVARRFPDKTAVLQGNDQLTYKELEQKTNQLANWICAHTDDFEAPIGIAYKSSPEFIIAILAVLKAGRAYMPLDRTYPTARLRQMIKLSKMQFALTDNEDFAKQNSDVNIHYIGNSQWQENLSTYSTELNSVSRGSDLAYVMFTSGSTGAPKGVMVPHKGIVRLVVNPDYIPVSEDTCTLLLCKLSFDVSTFEIWAPLLNGGKLVIYPDRDLTFSHLTKVLIQEKVNTLWLTAALFDGWLQSTDVVPKCLKYVMAGGDVFSPHSVRKLLELHPKVTFINGYGPTENTTFSTCYRLDCDTKIGTKIPIGQPISGSSVYIVECHDQLQPIGVVGELLVGGHGLATGYLHAEQLTSERFIERDFGSGLEKVYRTGDLVYWRQDGAIEYVGRSDQQVKVRGFRIELAEIETSLTSMSIVRDTAVICTDHDQLVAFVVREKAVDGDEIERINDEAFIDRINAFACENMPAYMVPSRTILIDALPISANGKLDRRSLILQTTDLSDLEDYVAPDSQIEEIIQEICQQYLGDRISVRANFFDLGGNSLIAMRMVGDVSKRLNMEVTTSSIFKYPSIEMMAKYITSMRDVTVLEQPKIQQIKNCGIVPLSIAQKQFWQDQALFGATSKHNIPGAFEIDGPFDLLAFEGALGTVIERHHILRTTYSGTPESPMATVNSDCELRLIRHDCSDISEKEQAHFVEKMVRKEIETPFNLEIDKMIRCRVIKISEIKHCVCLTLHHIAADGWSLNIIFSELELYYREILENGSAKFKELSLQYQDFAHWQTDYLKGEDNLRHIAYWKEYLADIPRIHSLPTDFQRPRQLSHHGEIHYQYFDSDVLNSIEKIVGDHRTTMFNFLQLTFSLLLGHWGDQDDIILGAPVAGREQSEVLDLVGCFTNTLVLRNKINVRNSFSQLLSASHQQWLESLGHQHVPFEQVLSALHPKRDPGAHPIFQIWFVLHSQASPGETFKLFNTEIEQRFSKNRMVKFDLMLGASVRDRQLCLEWQYSKDLFTADSIKKLSAAMSELLQQILKDSTRSIADQFSKLERIPREENRAVSTNKGVPKNFDSKSSPHTALQKEIHAAWTNLLHNDELSITTGFLDTGGNAFFANVLSKELKLITGVEVPLSVFMGNPTIRQLELFIEDSREMSNKILVEDSIELEF